jgi:hypothetical protein
VAWSRERLAKNAIVSSPPPESVGDISTSGSQPEIGSLGRGRHAQVGPGPAVHMQIAGFGASKLGPAIGEEDTSRARSGWLRGRR